MQRSLKQLLPTALIFGITALGSGAASSVHAAESYGYFQPSFLTQADRAMRRGQPANALAVLSENTQRRLKTRHRADALGIACRAHLALNDMVEARQACQSAADTLRNRSAWRHYNNLGVAELHLGNYEGAEAAFIRAASLSGWASTPRKNLSLVTEIREAREAANGEMVAAELR